MKILILGAKGNLGKQLTETFKDNYETLPLDLEDIDISREAEIKRRIKTFKPGAILNAVAYTRVDESEDEEKFLLAKKINGQAVGFLADCALETDAVLVHFSSEHIFDGVKKEGYKEDDKPNPINKYGYSKLLGEQEIADRIDAGLKYYLIRTSRLFGVTGESPMSKPSFFNMMLSLYARATTEGKKELFAVDEGVSSFTYTKDLAESIENFLAKTKTTRKKPYGIYHIVNEGKATWYEGARELFKISDIDVNIKPIKGEEYGGIAKRPKHSYLLNTKTEPLRHWREALEEYVKG